MQTYSICPCCNGTGLQVNLDGLKVLCPQCNGTGKVQSYGYNPLMIPDPYQPYWQPVYPRIEWTC